MCFSHPSGQLGVADIILQEEKGAHDIGRHLRYLLACALLHCGADKLANQRQELLRVPGVKLFQQSEQAQDKWWPIDRVGGLPADHS